MRSIAEGAAPSRSYVEALGAVLADETLDPAFRALCLQLPSEDDLAQTLHESGRTADPDAIHAAREGLAETIAEGLARPLSATYEAMLTKGPFAPDSASAGRRALRHAALAVHSRADGGARAAALFETADNMTESAGAPSLTSIAVASSVVPTRASSP